MQSAKLRFRDRSTMFKSEYLFFHILYSVMFACDTYVILPAVVPLARYNSSIPRLVICMLATNLFGLIFSFHYNRRGIGIAEDVVAGMGLYTILTVGKYAPVFTKWLLVGVAGFSVGEILLVFCRKVKNKNHVRPVMVFRFLRCTQIVRRNTGITTLVMIVFLIGFKYWQTNQMDEAYQKETSENSQNDLNVNVIYGDEYRLSNNIDAIKYIRDNDEFQTLSYDEKCDVIRAIIYCEARYLGLCELHIEFVDMNKDSLLGSYEHITKTISINAKTLRDGSIPGGSAEELLITALHECRHCYQHLLGELFQKASPLQRNLYAFSNEDVAEWVTNLKNYKTSDGTVDGDLEYRLQVVEWDANNYAVKEANVYYLEIDKFLAENTQE